MPQLIRSIGIEAPRSAVWRWLVTQDALHRWISPNIEINLRAGGVQRKPGWRDTVQGYEPGADRHQILEKLAAVVTFGLAA